VRGLAAVGCRRPGKVVIVVEVEVEVDDVPVPAVVAGEDEVGPTAT
jgi:hypothetical protein